MPSSHSPATETAAGLTDADLPGLFCWAEDVKSRGRRRLLTGTRIRLGLTVLVAVVAVAATPFDSKDVAWSAIVAAAGLLGAVFADLALLQMRPERDWVEGGALAEAIKSLAWRYAVGGDPFPAPHLRADDVFLDELDELSSAGQELDVSAAMGGPPISAQMRALRSAPFDVRKNAYLERRLGQEYARCVTAAARHTSLTRRWRIFLLCTEGIGVCAALLSALLWHVSIAGVAATIVAAGAAWLETQQHQTHAEAYSRAARDLGLARARIDKINQDEGWSRTVRQAEEVIQRGQSGRRLSG